MMTSKAPGFHLKCSKQKWKEKSPHKTPQPLFDVECAAQDDWGSLSSPDPLIYIVQEKDFEIYFVV